MTTPEERAYKATARFVRELFEALELDEEFADDEELEREINTTTDAVIARIDERLQERFGDLFGPHD